MLEIEIMNENKEFKGDPNAARLFDSAAAALEYMKQQQAATGDVITCTFIAVCGIEIPASNGNLESVAELLDQYGEHRVIAGAQLWRDLDGMDTLGDIVECYDYYLEEYLFN